jgi:hypothetical protein
MLFLKIILIPKNKKNDRVRRWYKGWRGGGEQLKGPREKEQGWRGGGDRP